jgi:hypothetical protein
MAIYIMLTMWCSGRRTEPSGAALAQFTGKSEPRSHGAHPRRLSGCGVESELCGARAGGLSRHLHRAGQRNGDQGRHRHPHDETWAFGHATTEIWPATEWDDFTELVRYLPPARTAG